MTDDRPLEVEPAQQSGPLDYGTPGGVMSIPPRFFHEFFAPDPAPIQPDDPDLVSLDDLAEALGFQPATLAERAELGHFPAVKGAGSWMVRRRDFAFALRSAAETWRRTGGAMPTLIQAMPVEAPGAVHADLRAAMAKWTPTIRTQLDQSPGPSRARRRRRNG